MEIWDTHLDISDLVNLVLLNEQKPQKNEVEDKNQYEIPQLDRRESYRIWLHELYKTRNSLSTDAVNNATMHKHGKLLELLKLVITELELKLTSADSFSSSSSEFRFWSSVQAMAHGCAFSFFDFMKVCTFPGANSIEYTSDFSIPGLVDHAPLSLEDEFTNSPHLGQQMISLPCPLQESSTLLYPLPFDNAVNSQRAGVQAGFSTGNTALCMPLMDQTMAVTVTVAECAENAHCSKRKFPAVLPGKCKRRIQRQRRRLANYDHLLTNFNISSCSLSWPSSRPLNPLVHDNHIVGTRTDLFAKNSNRSVDTELQFLLQKELKPSDVGSLGRIILPKRQAEEKLPHLDAKEGVIIAFEDLQSSQIWNLRFRFWPNNKTRMYLLECTGNFVKSHHLQKGDFIVLYRNPFTGNYMISGKKMDKREVPSVASEEALLDINSGLNLVNCPTTVHDEPLLVEKEGLDDQVKILQSTSTDVIDLEDPYDLMKGISTFEADGRSIDEIFNFD